MVSLPPFFILSTAVAQARRLKAPVVALESTVITHGLPYPQNLALARDMEKAVSTAGALPATVAVLDGKVHIGVTGEQLERLAQGEQMAKVSVRDFGSLVAQKHSGGTTVAGTILAAHLAGLKVMATGGIGGVHRHPPFDISADLQQLSLTPMIVVCSGAKAILDLPATQEMLETLCVPVVGYRTAELPAFFSPDSGLLLSQQADSPGEVAAIAQAHWRLRLKSAVLVVVPPPPEYALPYAEVLIAIEQALADALASGVRGQAITPFLLGRVSEITGGASLAANLALLENNARIAGEIAVSLAKPDLRQA
jgi:pseudouridine-5'-phosphate glycosidase